LVPTKQGKQTEESPDFTYFVAQLTTTLVAEHDNALLGHNIHLSDT